RIAACKTAGIKQTQLILDPGFGFGKTLSHNYQLLAQFNDFNQFGLPLLAGLSRKSMIGNLLNRNTNERLAGSLAGALIAAQNGAHIIRVHDVKETADVLNVLQACKQGVL
ncbi:MAG: dihydropteroate synthase, partial [Pseudoalteromonas distincta]